MPQTPLSRREALRAERAARRPLPGESQSPALQGPAAAETSEAARPVVGPGGSGPEETVQLSDAALPFLRDGSLLLDDGPEAAASGSARARRTGRGRSARPEADASARPPRSARRAAREEAGAPSGHKVRKAAMTWLGMPALFACVALPAYALNAQGEPTGQVVGQVDPGAQSLEIASGDAAAEQPAIRDEFLALSEAERTAVESGRISADGIMSYLRGSDEGWFRPVAAPMTSPYGPRRIICNEAGCSNPIHEGIDFGAACGTPVKAVAGGTVRFVGLDGGYGNRVIVDHGDGIASVYGHLGTGTATVAEGDVIEAGVFVGDVGRTGVGTGCHLDLKIEQQGSFTDPEAFLTSRGVVI
jgi:murein DD-endopeptidase MepM/ murein hydrolase activator NlpD